MNSPSIKANKSPFNNQFILSCLALVFIFSQIQLSSSLKDFSLDLPQPTGFEFMIPNFSLSTLLYIFIGLSGIAVILVGNLFSKDQRKRNQ